MRRFPAERLVVGVVEMPEPVRRHAVDVLRLGVGTVVELFDAEGRQGTGVIVDVTPLRIRIDRVTASQAAAGCVIVSAVPKGDRADWLVEKLGELGVAEWIPLRTARSVVHPEGVGKFDRWRRIAAEASRQSGRAGVLKIGPLTSFAEVIARPWAASRWIAALGATRPPNGVGTAVILVGPEGGWATEELEAAVSAGWKPIRLARTTLRIETAAIAAAAVLAAASIAAAVVPDVG